MPTEINSSNITLVYVLGFHSHVKEKRRPSGVGSLNFLPLTPSGN
jgi:hypothetical protein